MWHISLDAMMTCLVRVLSKSDWGGCGEGIRQHSLSPACWEYRRSHSMLHILHGSWCEQECLHKEREREREREGERLVNHYLHWILNLGHSTSLWARCFTEVATAFVQEQWLGTVTRQFLGRFLATLIRVVKWSSQRMQCRMQRPVAKRGDHLWPTRCNCRLLSQHPRL